MEERQDFTERLLEPPREARAARPPDETGTS
jgi:hypothetical protein